jgi:hypothetical protein
VPSGTKAVRRRRGRRRTRPWAPPPSIDFAGRQVETFRRELEVVDQASIMNRGHMLADVSAILGSLDIVFGEIDR